MVVTVLSRLFMMIGIAAVTTRVMEKRRERKMTLAPVKVKKQ